MDIIYTDEFVKRFKKLPKSIQKLAVKQEELFKVAPFYPSLHTEKLVPKSKQLWSIRIDRKYRIIFRKYSDTSMVFLTVGEHNWVYSYINRL